MSEFHGPSASGRWATHGEASQVAVRAAPSGARPAGFLHALARGLLGLALAAGFGGPTTGCEEDSSVDRDAGPCPQVASPAPGFCLDGRIETVEDQDGCPTLTCVPNECPVYQRPECAEGEQVEVTTDEAGCNIPRCVPAECPQVAAPPADFCPAGERIEQYVNDARCTDFRCVPAECPIYQIPQCSQGEHVETVLNGQGCFEPVCVADLDP